jgi:hypothetical protein
MTGALSAARIRQAVCRALAVCDVEDLEPSRHHSASCRGELFQSGNLHRDRMLACRQWGVENKIEYLSTREAWSLRSVSAPYHWDRLWEGPAHLDG